MRNTPLYIVVLVSILFVLSYNSCEATYSNTGCLFNSSKNDSVLTRGLTFSQIGEASTYGDEFINRNTSSGEKYSKDDYTAAHPFLEFGTCLRVTNLKNDREVIVRVNDRGPKKKGRILDLSYAASQELGLGEDGTGQVKIETMAEPKGPEQKEVVGTRNSRIPA